MLGVAAVVAPTQAAGPPLSTLAASWEGMVQNGSGIRPPDPHGAAGPNGILQVVNTRVAYWSKAGKSNWGPIDFEAFFPWSAANTLSDPRAMYDPITQRFYLEILELDFNNSHSYINVAVSKSSNPATGTTSDWYLYRIENTRKIGASYFWGDYPGFGFDSQAIYVTLNLYDFAGPPGDCQITVLNKASLISGTTNYAFVYIPGGASAAFTLQPCSVFSTTGPTNVAYFAETLPADSSTKVRVWALQDPLGARTVSSASVTVPNNGGAPLGEAPQPGTTTTIDPSDGRTQGNAFWQNGSVWFCTTAGGSSGRSMAYYYKVNVDSFPGGAPTLGESGNINGGAGMWTYQPSIGGTVAGDVCMVYCESSTATYPTILYTARAAGASSFETPTILKASPGYANTDRWGDYGSVTVDPINQTFWVTHEWAKSTAAHNWSTWWGNVVLSAQPSITSQPADLVVLNGSPAAFQVTAGGSTPLNYQWRRGGTNIAGATTSAYSIAAAQPSDAGVYSVVVTNAIGSATSSNATLTVIFTVPLPYALNNSNLTWTTTSRPWHGQTNYSHDGVAAAESGLIADGQTSTLRTTVTGPGLLTFWWSVSSQPGADKLTFASSAGITNSISGEVSWQQQSVYLPDGLQTLAWTYSKDATGKAGVDRGWVDQVFYVLGMPIVAWGANDFGQSQLPASGTNALAIAAGSYHNLLLQPDGSVQAWGANFDGQCDVPASVTNAVAIAGGGYHSLALNANGTVTAWGADYYGQATVPSGATNVVAIAAGTWHSLALRTDGKVVAWGDDNWGQTEVPANLAGVVGIAAGGQHSLALKGDGTVVGWGDNSDASGIYAGQANPPSNLRQVRAIAAGDFHSLALQAGGKVQAWGDNSQGQATVPSTLSNAVAIAAGGNHNLAIQGGKVIGWGGNLYGQSTVPTNVVNATAIAAGASHSLALMGQTQPSQALSNAMRSGNTFTVSVPTVRGTTYYLQYKATLNTPDWFTVAVVPGDGSVTPMTDPTASGAQRFYRVWQQ